MENSKFRQQFKIVTLNKGTGNRSIFFVPGGPGMKASCFKEFAEHFLSEFTVHSIDFTGNGNVSRKAWIKVLKSILSKRSYDILIGHSFGGMLLLSTRELDRLAKGRVIISAAPDMGWINNASAFKLAPDQVSEIEAAEQQFKNRKSEKALKDLWKSWAPYYFRKRFLSQGALWLAQQRYIPKPYLNTKKLLLNYKMNKRSEIKTLFIGGKFDKLTPVTAFETYIPRNNYNVSIRQIPSAGHFPWVEAPQTLAQVLLRFIENITEG